MDLTRLYNLTTPELRAEADRLGVQDTYALSRAQLIHAIRSQVEGPHQEGLFGRVLGFAKWALQTAAPPAEAPAASSALSESPPVPEPEGEEERSSRDETKRFSRPADGAAPSAAPTAFATEVSMGEARASSEPPPGAGDSSTPVGVFSGGELGFEEPFPTLTMARILAEQGHYKRSLAIYANLLREDPEDSELRVEADEVRSQSRARRSHP